VRVKNLLAVCSSEISDLFLFMNDQRFVPLQCKEKVAHVFALTDGDKELGAYKGNLLRLSTYRTLTYLSRCYTNMRFQKLFDLLDFIPADKVESYVVDIALNGNLNIKLDHLRSAVLFQQSSENRLLYKVGAVSSALFSISETAGLSATAESKAEAIEDLIG
jgi:hypothetical protein